MLVLTRKLNEKLIIGSNIVITIVRIDGLQVRIGIEAPREVTVLREEIAPPQKTGQYHHQLDRPEPGGLRHGGGAVVADLPHDVLQQPWLGAADSDPVVHHERTPTALRKK